MGIAQYVTYKRLERAKELLRESNSTVAAISAQVGVDDYNYFCKLFRKHEGCTPMQYRKQRTSD